MLRYFVRRIVSPGDSIGVPILFFQYPSGLQDSTLMNESGQRPAESEPSNVTKVAQHATRESYLVGSLFLSSINVWPSAPEPLIEAR